jgi:NitT/TauT family transport system substrate-binding protein
MRRSSALSGMVLALAAMSTGRRAAGAQAPASINVTTTPTESGMQVYYAQDRSFFKAVGLETQVQAISNGGAVVSAVMSGATDIGESNVVSLAAAHGRGLDLVVIAPATLSAPSKVPSAALIVARNSPIKTASDLNGKTIAGNGLGNIMQIASAAWMAKYGGDPSTAKFVEMPFSEMPVALQSGRIDAAMISNPVLGVALAQGARILGDALDAIAPRMVIGAWFTTRAWAKTHPDLVRKFERAMRLSAIWANANPAQSAVLIARYTGSPVEPGTQRVVYAEKMDVGLIQPLIDASARYGTLKATFPAMEFIAPEAL